MTDRDNQMTALPLANKRIFIVDDHPGNMFVMASLLQKAGAETGYDLWGVTTLERLRTFSPVDLILMDLMIPGTSGYELFDKIHMDMDFAKVPILAVSAGDPSSAIPRVRAKGFIGFIAKPIDYDQFNDQIFRALNNQPVWGY